MITTVKEMYLPLEGWAERFPLRVCSGFAPARRESHLRDMRESRLCVLLRVGSDSGAAEFKNLMKERSKDVRYENPREISPDC